MCQLPRLWKRELICLLLFTCNYVVSVWRGFLFLSVLGMGFVILLWHSLSLPYNYFTFYTQSYTPPLPLLPQLHTLNISRAGSAVFSLPSIYQYYTQRPEAVFRNLQVLDTSYPYYSQSLSECEESRYYWQFCRTGLSSPNSFLRISQNCTSSISSVHSSMKSEENLTILIFVLKPTSFQG